MSQVFSVHWNGAAYTCKEKLWRNVTGDVLLCQGILETRQKSHLHGLALFTIPLNNTAISKILGHTVNLYGFFSILHPDYAKPKLILDTPQAHRG